MTRHETEEATSSEGASVGEDRYAVQPVVKALHVLSCVCNSPNPLSLNDIFLQLDIPKTTVFRYLRSLMTHDLVEHDPELDRYRPGIGLWRLSQMSNPYETLRQACLPFMKQLQRRFNETVNLGVLAGNEVLYLEIIESDWSLRMRAEVGARDMVHCTALGKALLAFRPTASQEAILPTVLPAVTSRTITDRKALLDQFDVIRATGYAVDLGENEAGSCCIASPICDTRGVSIASLSISGPATRVDGDMRQSICAALITACADIAQMLNHGPVAKIPLTSTQKR